VEMVWKFMAKQNERTNSEENEKNELSFSSIAMIGSRVPFRCRFPRDSEGAVPWHGNQQRNGRRESITA